MATSMMWWTPRGVALLCPAHNANATWNANYFAVTVPVDDPREELVTMMAGGYTALA